MISKKEGLVEGLQPLTVQDQSQDQSQSKSQSKSGSESSASVSLHHACHSRAQNNGFKAKMLLELIPNLKINTIERCSGHGGSFGVRNSTFPSAVKVGKQTFLQAKKNWEKANSQRQRNSLQIYIIIFLKIIS